MADNKTSDISMQYVKENSLYQEPVSPGPHTSVDLNIKSVLVVKDKETDPTSPNHIDNRSIPNKKTIKEQIIDAGKQHIEWAKTQNIAVLVIIYSVCSAVVISGNSNELYRLYRSTSRILFNFSY